MKTIPLNNGYEALVDDEDYEELFKHEWSISRDSQCVIRRDRNTGKGILMARVIMNAPDYLEVDHRDGNRVDMQKFNLRLCTRSQNTQNSRKRKGTSSKYKGVNFDYHRGTWRVMIGLQDIFGKTFQKYLGRFTSEEEAAKAYDEAARFYFKEFAKLNFAGEGEQSCL